MEENEFAKLIIPVEAYLEDINYYFNNKENLENNLDMEISDKFFEEHSDCWGDSNWEDFLGCNENEVESFFESQLC